MVRLCHFFLSLMQVITCKKGEQGGIMKINNQVHFIRKEFDVTPEVKRYVNIYLIEGEYCYLVDSGVAGTHILIEEVPWIEDIQKQFSQRPIPNFFHLLSESVKVSQPLKDGDAIPVTNDLPIFIHYEQTVRSLELLQNIAGIRYYCPAWDVVYDKNKLDTVIANSKSMLFRLKDAVLQVEEEFPEALESEKLHEIYKRAELLHFSGNPLVAKSIEACRRK